MSKCNREKRWRKRRAIKLLDVPELPAEKMAEAKQVIYQPEAIPHKCRQNVNEKVKREGGKRVFGWIVRESKGPYWNLIGHCVWQDQAGNLIDITPNDYEEATLFVPDKRAYGLPLALSFRPEADEAFREDLRQHSRELNEEYWLAERKRLKYDKS